MMSDMFRCLSCGEMLFTDAGSCRFCGAAIDPAAALVAARQQAAVTRACSVANNIKFSWLLAPCVVAAQAFLVFAQIFRPRLWLLLQAIPLALAGTALAWLWRYRSLATSDPDFPAARKSVKRTLCVWLAASATQLTLLGVYLSRTFLPDGAGTDAIN